MLTTIADFFRYIKQASSLKLYLASIRLRDNYLNEDTLYLLYKSYIRGPDLIFEAYFATLNQKENYTYKINTIEDYIYKGYFWTCIPENNNIVGHKYLNPQLDEMQWIKDNTKFDQMVWLKEIQKDNKIYDFYIDPTQSVFKITFPIKSFNTTLKIGDINNGNTIGCTIEDTLHDKAPIGLRPTGF